MIADENWQFGNDVVRESVDGNNHVLLLWFFALHILYPRLWAGLQDVNSIPPGRWKRDMQNLHLILNCPSCTVEINQKSFPISIKTKAHLTLSITIHAHLLYRELSACGSLVGAYSSRAIDMIRTGIVFAFTILAKHVGFDIFPKAGFHHNSAIEVISYAVDKIKEQCRATAIRCVTFVSSVNT